MEGHVAGSFGVLRDPKGQIRVTRVTTHKMPHGNDDVITEINVVEVEDIVVLQHLPL